MSRRRIQDSRTNLVLRTSNLSCLGRKGPGKGLRPTRSPESQRPQIQQSPQRVPRPREFLGRKISAPPMAISPMPGHGRLCHIYPLLVHIFFGPIIYGDEKQSTTPACPAFAPKQNGMGLFSASLAVGASAMEAKALAGRVESTPTETLRTGGEEIKGDCTLWKSNRAVGQMIRLPPLPEWLLGASAGLGRVLTII